MPSEATLLSMDELVEDLSGPGGRFEVSVEHVAGHPMEVYRERMRSLREIPAAARRRGDERPFIVHGQRRIGFASFVDTANALSHGLTLLGVDRGDRVAVLAQNCPEWALTFWGTVDLGAVLVGLNGWWKADEIRYGLQDSGSRVLVADLERIERITDTLDTCPALEHVLLIDCDPADVGLETDPRVRSFRELAAAPTQELPTAPIEEDDPAVILYTSGTTGRPKGAITTHRNMIASLQNTLFASVYTKKAATTGDGTTGKPVSLLTSPLFHVAGLHSSLVTGFLAGATLVLIEGRFDPGTALRLIQDERVTVWAAVPTLVRRLCEHPARHDHDTSTVRTVAFGGSPPTPELQRLVAETFPNARGGSNVYGLTEASGTVTFQSPTEAAERPGSVGRPMPTMSIRILTDDGTDAPVGGVGEVAVRGPTVMPGYWGKPEATAEMIRDGWLLTGDVGRRDEAGYLYITDRKKDMIIRGGENVYCVEIEERLLAHPEVLDAAVVGVPHPELGEQVKAVVQLAAESGLNADGVRSWVADALADFKIPSQVELRAEALPRNPSGKVLKNTLRGQDDGTFAELL